MAGEPLMGPIVPPASKGAPTGEPSPTASATSWLEPPVVLRVPTMTRSATPWYCVKRPPGAPLMGVPTERGPAHAAWPVEASTACTSPRSSAANRTDRPGKTGEVLANGTTGERDWATPVRAYGTQLEGQRPPFAPPLVSEWTVRSFDMARIPAWPTTGG